VSKVLQSDWDAVRHRAFELGKTFNWSAITTEIVLQNMAYVRAEQRNKIIDRLRTWPGAKWDEWTLEGVADLIEKIA
jgi:hypothetical protein